VLEKAARAISRREEAVVSTERVDKAWQSKGLKEYPLEAVLGTLGHYGIQVDEAEFRQLAEKQYPAGIAMGWVPRWKGIGKFAPFPFAAAAELWRRWLPEKLAPMELSESLARLVWALGAKLRGLGESAVGPAFESVNSLRSRIPLDEKGAPDEDFVNEALSVFDERATRVFDELAELLAKEGHVEEAEAFAQLEEFLLPMRQGVSRAVVRAARGERDAAIEDLKQLASDGARAPISRMLATDALLHLNAFEPVVSIGRPLMEEAERQEDWYLALDMCAQLEFACTQLGDRTGMMMLERDRDRLEAAHDAAHPVHLCHRH
jgi:hypothetical protein